MPIEVTMLRGSDGGLRLIETAGAGVATRTVQSTPAGPRRAEDLTDSERAPGEAALAAALGRAPSLGELRRLRLAPDGSWLLAWREPKASRAELGPMADRPWEGKVPLLSVERVGAFADVIALLAEPDNPDAEMARRDQLVADRVRQIETQRTETLERERQQNAEAQRQREERQRIEREFRRNEWDRLPATARVLFLVALAVEDGGDVPKAIRSLAREMASDYGQAPAFPARRWW